MVSQNKLLPNTNIRARELRHELNNTTDTLKLKGGYEIEVVKFLGDFTTIIDRPYSREISYSLKGFPKGKLLVMVGINGKFILFVIYIEDNEYSIRRK